jgi:hypothetical protein
MRPSRATIFHGESAPFFLPLFLQNDESECIWL